MTLPSKKSRFDVSIRPWDVIVGSVSLKSIKEIVVTPTRAPVQSLKADGDKLPSGLAQGRKTTGWTVTITFYNEKERRKLWAKNDVEEMTWKTLGAKGFENKDHRIKKVCAWEEGTGHSGEHASVTNVSATAHCYSEDGVKKPHEWKYSDEEWS